MKWRSKFMREELFIELESIDIELNRLSLKNLIKAYFIVIGCV